jgi:hypothetical protein
MINNTLIQLHHINQVRDNVPSLSTVKHASLERVAHINNTTKAKLLNILLAHTDCSA